MKLNKIELKIIKSCLTCKFYIIHSIREDGDFCFEIDLEIRNKTCIKNGEKGYFYFKQLKNIEQNCSV